MKENESRSLWIGRWRVDLASGEVRRGGAGEEAQRLEPKLAAVLAVLARRPGEVVAKEEILAEVWADTFVTEDVLWRSIAGLRRIFGDDPKNPRVIETLPRRGYRLVAPVRREAETPAPSPEPAQDGPAELAPATVPRPDPPGPAARWLAPAALALLAVLAAALLWAYFAHGSAGDVSAAEAGGVPYTDASELPDSAEGLYQLGRSYYVRLEPEALDAALELYHRAIEADPGFAPAHAGIGNANGLKYLYDEDPTFADRALAAARRAVELDSTLAEAHKALALAHQVQGHYGEAVHTYRRALELDPSHAPSAHNLGILYRDLGELDQAIYWVGQTAPNQPETVALHHANLGLTYYLLGDLGRARRHAETALLAEPDDPWPCFLLDRIDLVEGRLDEARERGRRLLAKHPESSFVLGSAGLVAHVAGDLETAQRLLGGALERAESGDERRKSALALAAVLQKTGEGAEARRLLAELEGAVAARLERGDESWQSRFYLAGVAALRGRPREALDRLDQAVVQGFRDHRGLAIDPVFSSLRSERRFRELLEQLGHREETMESRVVRLAAHRAGSPDR